MKIFPVFNADGFKTSAFEVENAYIGVATIINLLKNTECVTEIKPRKIFDRSCDIHVEFKYMEQPFIVWEPFGDNSRYWIGPQDRAESGIDITELEKTIANHKPTLIRKIVGDILSLRLINK
jgi:hypothetical protein